jgi:hyperosmotically inducible protein
MRYAPLSARAGLLIVVALMVGACSATRTQESPGEVVDDSTLTAKVKSALVADPVTKAGEINVETYRGVVQLAGFVNSAEEKSKATEVAKGVTGVKEVRNDIKLAPAGQETAGKVIDDTMITAAVKTKLIADSQTKAYQINVEVQDGVVQLAGFVGSNDEKTRAGELARGCGRRQERPQRPRDSAGGCRLTFPCS